MAIATAVFDLCGTLVDVAGAARIAAETDALLAAAGAGGHGFRAVRVKRTGAPQDRLRAAPAPVVADLSALPALV